MNMTFVYKQKMDFSICVNTVGFPKYSHIYSYITDSNNAYMNWIKATEFMGAIAIVVKSLKFHRSISS